MAEKNNLSIIIPVYKAEQFLKECLDSVLSSTFTNFELILVDDGSPDLCGTICDDYASKDNRIKVVHVENGGVSRARNIGIEISTAPWITFIDADDFIEPAYIEQLYEAVNSNTDIDFVQAGCQIYIGGVVKGIEYKYNDVVDTDMGYLFREFRGLIVSKMFKRELLNSNPKPIRFDERLRSQEDMIFTLDYVNRVSKYAFLDCYGYFYRVDNTSSISHTLQVLTYSDKHHIFCHHYSSVSGFIKKHNVSMNDSIRRRHQVADSLEFSIYSLFTSNEYSFNERTRLLKENYTRGHLDYLNYCKGKRNKILFFCLRKRLYVLFNLLTTLKLIKI